MLGIEDINVRGLARTKLSKSIYDVAFGEIRRQLVYKAAWIGGETICIDRFYPSSKRCNACGRVNDELEVNDRLWECRCGVVNDRDLNAARTFGMKRCGSD